MSLKLGGFMVRWLIHDSDYHHNMNHGIHPSLNSLIELKKRGVDQEIWFGITHESFNAFLNQAKISLENIDPAKLKKIIEEMGKAQLPSDLTHQIQVVLSEQKMLESEMELELLLHVNGDTSFRLPWESLCHLSTKGTTGIYQGIKACWMALFRPGVLSEILKLDIEMNKLQVSVLVRPAQLELMRGKAFSFSPRCPWDRRHSVVTYEKGSDALSFLVDRSTHRSTYYGKNYDGKETKKKNNSTMGTPKPHDTQINFAYHEVQKVAEYLQLCEKQLDSMLQLEWSMGLDQRIRLRRVESFNQSPSLQQMAPQFNTTARNVWDQSMMRWNPNALLKPFWFSLLPRNFRVLSINYIRTLGIKDQIAPSYEKVFRGFWGILRGRPYINLGAFHSFLGISESYDLAEEIEINVSLWLKRYDRESRDAWNLQWSQWPTYTHLEKKKVIKNINQMIKHWPEKLSIWINEMHNLREALVSAQWKEKNVSEMVSAFQEWERKYIPTLVPVLMAEIQYRNIFSWYCEGAHKALLNQSTDPSWIQVFESGGQELNSSIEGSWFEKRSKAKMIKQLETLYKMRSKYLSMLDDVHAKLRKFFEVMGQKYQAMGQLDRSEDLFYLTFEEILAFEEGRAATVAWKQLVSTRQEEYRQYSHDVKVPETWLTTGLVGLAAQFPGVISIRENKGSLPITGADSSRGVGMSFNESTSKLDFIENEDGELQWEYRDKEV